MTECNFTLIKSGTESALNFLMSTVQFLDTHDSAITALATIALAVLTWILAKENRLLRKAGTEPEVIAYLIPDKHHTHCLNFVLANVGRGVAKNISLEFRGKSDDFSDTYLRVDSQGKTSFHFLPQDEKFVFLFSTATQLLKENAAIPLSVKITYQNGLGIKRQTEHELNISGFKDFSYKSNSPEKESAKALKDIEKHLRIFTQSSKRIKVETITAKQAREEEQETIKKLKKRQKK